MLYEITYSRKVLVEAKSEKAALETASEWAHENSYPDEFVYEIQKA